ncbi:hypothetical protein AX769_16025 [Frondihabitans sp. PAMC 28766]|uniref:hypothetical protein n=1 Tax=Frondihabitans sp. PAMC 28766 TaxID=1795630 RepID=UPI00078E136E|nr:hypothetical protein [Frondihabitans sp. PAMC 28766]AMM21362.1 hypothetical protein AX769_16025 [Frondihabitans sp. PAMC 28766]
MLTRRRPGRLGAAAALGVAAALVLTACGGAPAQKTTVENAAQGVGLASIRGLITTDSYTAAGAGYSREFLYTNPAHVHSVIDARLASAKYTPVGGSSTHWSNGTGVGSTDVRFSTLTLAGSYHEPHGPTVGVPDGPALRVTVTAGS